MTSQHVDSRIEIELSEALDNFLEALAERINDIPREVNWKIRRAHEKAKVWSVSQPFQTSVAALRERWDIIPHLDEQPTHPREVFQARTQHMSEIARAAFEQDLVELARQFKLDWNDQDYGLMVTAVWYGLTPDIILAHWDKIQTTMAASMRMKAQIHVETRTLLMDNLRCKLVIAYLLRQIGQTGSHISIPQAFQDLLQEAVDLFRDVKTANQAIGCFERIRDYSFAPELCLRLEPGTELEDIKRIWPQVELVQAELHLAPNRRAVPRRTRIWQTFERDVFCWRKVRLDGMSYREAHDAWLLQHPEENRPKVVDDSLIIRAVQKIDKLQHKIR